MDSKADGKSDALRDLVDTGALTVDDLRALVDTGRELAAEVNLKSLLRDILDKASKLTNSIDASVILPAENRKKLYIAHAIGPNGQKVLKDWGESSQGIPLESIAGKVFETGESLVVNAVEADPDHYRGVDRQTGTTTTAMVCVPMSLGDQMLGVIQILNKRNGEYTERDRILLEHFAAQSAIAVRNARLFEDLLAHMGFYTSRDETKSPAELLDELTRPAHPEELSILFADMRGFTQLCQSVDGPAVIQKVLDDFLGMLAGVIISHRGIVNKFLGDGVMALFRDDAEENKALRAVQCAVDILDGFDRLYKLWRKSPSLASVALDELELGIGIGITTGNVIIGAIGSDRVCDFTPIGIVVNLAGYLMDRARGDKRILVDGSTYLAVADSIEESCAPTSFIYRKHENDKGGRPLVYYHVKGLKSLSGPPSPASSTASPLSVKPSCDVFISYSHKDVDWLVKLKTHLTPFIRGGITFWDDTKIQTGDLWREEIKVALDAARVAILLVSPDFLNSDFIDKNELPPLLAAVKNKALRIFWVPISYSSVEETEICKYQAAFSPSRPLKEMSEVEQDKVLVNLCKDIRRATQG